MRIEVRVMCDDELLWSRWHDDEPPAAGGTANRDASVMSDIIVMLREALRQAKVEALTIAHGKSSPDGLWHGILRAVGRR